MSRVPYSKIVIGQKEAREYSITQQVYDHFLAAFEDTSPIHVDEARAKEMGFSGRVMHGAILNGFISHFVGVHFPGEHALLQSVAVQYKAPNYLGDRVRIDAEVVQKIDAVRVIVLEMKIYNMTQNTLTATAKVQIGLRK